MRGFLTVVAVLAILWSGWWGAASYLAASSVRAWFDDQARFGRMAGHDGVAMAGFPRWVSLRLENPYLANPFIGLSWAASGMELRATLHPPLRLEARLPQRQTVRLPDGTVAELHSENAHASARLAGLDLRLDQAELTGSRVVLTTNGQAGAAVQAFGLRLRAEDGAPARYRVVLELEGLDGPSPAGPLPARAELLALAGAMTLSAPLDRHLDSRPAPPSVEAIDIDALRLVWGRVELEAKGGVQADAQGLAEGRIDLRIGHWRDLLAAAVAMGALDPEIADTWERALKMIAAEDAQAAAEDALVTALTFRSGRMRIGPLPIGPAPRLGPPGQ